MIEIKNPDYDAPEYDICGYREVVAILKINNMILPLCKDCIKELSSEIQTYNNTPHCYECKNFVNTNGLSYGGGCRYESENNGDHLTDQEIIYKYHVETCDSCEHFVR